MFPYNYIQAHNWAVTQSGGGCGHCGGDESFNDGHGGRLQREHETLFFEDNDQGKVVKHSGEYGSQSDAALFKRPHKNKVHNDIENDSDECDLEWSFHLFSGVECGDNHLLGAEYRYADGVEECSEAGCLEVGLVKIASEEQERYYFSPEEDDECGQWYADKIYLPQAEDQVIEELLFIVSGGGSGHIGKQDGAECECEYADRQINYAFGIVESRSGLRSDKSGQGAVDNKADLGS